MISDLGHCRVLDVDVHQGQVFPGVSEQAHRQLLVVVALASPEIPLIK